MPDEVDVYTRLESPLYGGLLQVLDALCRATAADCAAGRVFGLDGAAVDSCVVAGRLNLGPDQEAALDDWPHQRGNVFELMYRLQPPAGVFRPRDKVDEADYAASSLFRPLDALRPVTDCVCEAVELGSDTWGLLCYLRCAPCLPFHEGEIDLLRRFHPVAQRHVQAALRHEMRPGNAIASPDSAHAVPLSQMLARLSRTECQVLGYLRTRFTERQIARELRRSPHTIHVHVKNIYRKFGVSSRKQLMEFFIER